MAANGAHPGADLGASEARTAHAGPAHDVVAAHGIAANGPCRLAGLSALARYSMLTEPKWPIYALTAADWKAAQDAGVCELTEPEAGAQEWQLWSYSPALMPDANTVDPLACAQPAGERR